MLVWKTLRFKVHRPTASKRRRLAWLWQNWGRTGYRMHDNMANRYPTKRVLNQWGCLGLKDNPRSTVARWWLRLPIVQGERINLPIRGAAQHESLLGNAKVCNSELIRRGPDFFIHITIKREVSPPFAQSQTVLAVDIGERVIATSVAWDGFRVSEPRFHARAVRGVRRHYGWLRSRLQERGHYRTMARVKHAEGRRVNDLLHKTARAIVEDAAKLGATVAVGDLRGIRVRSRGRGKHLNRLINAMPFNRLSFLIRYKAEWAGVPVMFVREDYSSIECRVCNGRGTRPSQGLFSCTSCGEYNADLNGAVNIGKRALRYIREVGAPGFGPQGVAPGFCGTA